MRPYVSDPAFFGVRKIKIVRGANPVYPELSKLILEGTDGDSIEINVWSESGAPPEVTVDGKTIVGDETPPANSARNAP